MSFDIMFTRLGVEPRDSTTIFKVLPGKFDIKSHSISHSCIDVHSDSCLHPLSNERKSMLKSGDSCMLFEHGSELKNA